MSIQGWFSLGLIGLVNDAAAPIVWPPDVKSQLTGKDPDAGKDKRQKKKSMAEDEMIGRKHWFSGKWTWANSKSWWGTGKPGLLQAMGSQRAGYDLATEQQLVFSRNASARVTLVHLL